MTRIARESSNAQRTSVLLALATVLLVLLAVLLLLAAPLLLLGALLPTEEPGDEITLATAAVFAGSFVLLGATAGTLAWATWRRRRWVRPVMLSLTAIWLLLGLSFMGSEELRGWAVVVGGVALPLLLLLAYASASPWQVTPAPARHSWTDAVPLPVFVVGAWNAMGVPVFLASAAWFPETAWFGAVLGGWHARILNVFLAAFSGWLAVAVFRLRMAGWWATLAFSLVFTLAHVTTDASAFEEFYRQKGLSEAEIAEEVSSPAVQSPLLAVGAPSVAYVLLLLYVRRFFVKNTGSVPPNGS